MPPKKSTTTKKRSTKNQGAGFFKDLYDGANKVVSDPLFQKVATVGIPIAVKLLAGKITRLEAHMGLNHKMTPDEEHHYLNHPRTQELGAGFLDGVTGIANGFMHLFGGNYDGLQPRPLRGDVAGDYHTGGHYDVAGDYQTGGTYQTGGDEDPEADMFRRNTQPEADPEFNAFQDQPIRSTTHLRVAPGTLRMAGKYKVAGGIQTDKSQYLGRTAASRPPITSRSQGFYE